jgi:hypothetical protein
MKVKMLGSIRRESGMWYAAYTESHSLIEFRLMNDTSPAIVGKIKQAADRGKVEVNLNVNDVAEFHGVKK